MEFVKQNENDELSRILKFFPKKLIMMLSVMQICCGILALISRHYFLGEGLWTGPIFGIAGFIGFMSCYNPSKIM